MADVIEYIIKLKDEISGTLKNIEGHTEHMNSTMEESKSIVGGLQEAFVEFFAIEKIFEFVSEGVEDFRKYNEALQETQLALKNTQGVSGQTMESLKELNEQVFFHSKFEKEAIFNSEKLLLAFTNVRGAIYTQAIPAIADLAAFTKTEMPEATRMLGRALNDPINGIQRLRMLVPGLTKAMSDHIAVTAHLKGIQAAQAELLDDVARATKGAAAAALDSDPWALFGKAMQEAKEKTGEFLTEGLNKLMPFVKDLYRNSKPITDLYKEMWGAVSDLWQEIKKLANELGLATDHTSAAKAVIQGLKISLEVSMAPIRAAIAVIKGLVEVIRFIVYWVKEAWKEIEKLIVKIQHVIQAVKDFAKHSKILSGIWGGMKAVFAKAGEGIKWVWDHTIKPIVEKLKWAYSIIRKIWHMKDAKVPGASADKEDTPMGEADKTGGVTSPKFDMPTIDMPTGKVSESKPIHIDIKIDSLNKGGINISTTNLTESVEKIQEIVTQMFLNVVNNGQQIATR